MRHFDTKQLTLAAILAAVYAALTLCLPSYTPIQIRLSEALTVLPFLFPAATPGVIVGCFVANLLSPYGVIDVVCGTLATALAALLTARMSSKWLAPLPPVLCNAGFGPNFPALYAMNAFTVGLGELVSCYGLGLVILTVLPRIPYLRGRMAPQRL